MSDPLRVAAGSLFIVGVGEAALTKVEAAWIRLLQPAGIILFRRNIVDAAQTHALLADAAGAVDAGLFRCVDLEGGTVDRLRDALAPMPSAAAVAGTGNRKLARRQGELIGLAARAFGFNTVFAPVLDLALPASNAVMQTRVASADAGKVAAYASQVLAGLEKNRVLGCGKHFPGLGGGDLDSHAAMPRIQRNWEQLWAEDLAPYRTLRREMAMVMVSHAAYPLVAEAGDGPASASRFWITEVLRRRVGFKGLVVSDDMEMGGALGQREIEGACVAAIAAGTDLVEICHKPELVLRGYEAVLREAERSAAFRGMVLAAAQRVAAAKRRMLRGERMVVPSTAQLEKLRREIARLGEDVARAAAR